MAKEFSRDFYNSPQWRKTRAEYIKSVGGMCEDCMKHNIYNAGVIVHHIEELTPSNIHNPEITMGFKNLKLVCRECHAKEHMKKQARYYIDENGRPIVTSPWGEG